MKTANKITTINRSVNRLVDKLIDWSLNGLTKNSIKIVDKIIDKIKWINRIAISGNLNSSTFLSMIWD